MKKAKNIFRSFDDLCSGKAGKIETEEFSIFQKEYNSDIFLIGNVSKNGSCLTVVSRGNDNITFKIQCKNYTGRLNQQWYYNDKVGIFTSVSNGLSLENDLQKNKLTLANTNNHEIQQFWKYNEANKTIVSKANKKILGVKQGKSMFSQKKGDKIQLVTPSKTIKNHQMWNIINLKQYNKGVEKLYSREEEKRSKISQTLPLRFTFAKKFNSHLPFGEIFKDLSEPAGAYSSSLIKPKKRIQSDLYSANQLKKKKKPQYVYPLMFFIEKFTKRDQILAINSKDQLIFIDKTNRVVNKESYRCIWAWNDSCIVNTKNNKVLHYNTLNKSIVLKEKDESNNIKIFQKFSFDGQCFSTRFDGKIISVTNLDCIVLSENSTENSKWILNPV